jgi:hypothetical protein
MVKARRILMMAFPDCQMLDVTGPLQMFAGVNDELGRQAYELVIAAPKRGPFKTSSGVGLVADLAIADVSPAKCRDIDRRRRRPWSLPRARKRRDCRFPQSGKGARGPYRVRLHWRILPRGSGLARWASSSNALALRRPSSAISTAGRCRS